MPTQIQLYKMEYVGIPVDNVTLKDLISKLINIQNLLEKDIYALHGSRFNLASVTDVGKVLGLHRKHAKAKPSTSKQVLSKMQLPIANFIMQYRKITAALNNTLKPIVRSIEENKGSRLHVSSFSFTTTGRISMLEPNVQNVPKDFEIHFLNEKCEKIACRSIFRAEYGKCFISADFCQLELRILTHLSREKHLLKIMHSDNDVFKLIASEWFKIDMMTVKELERNHAKQICYGLIYGMGKKTLAEALNTSEEEAELLRKKFICRFPGIKSFTDDVVSTAKKRGFVETITGRR